MIRRQSIKFQIIPMKDVRGVTGTRSDGRNVRRTDGRTYTRTDEGHFYSPPPPTSVDKEEFPIPFSVSNDLIWPFSVDYEVDKRCGIYMYHSCFSVSSRAQIVATNISVVGMYHSY